jgi:hypothetical protein
MTNKISPISTLVAIDENGNPRAGAKLFGYITGTTTKAALTKDEAGLVSHTNPIILNARGEVADIFGSRQDVWQPAGQPLDWILAPSNDTDPPTTPYWTLVNVPAINDVDTSTASAQWTDGTEPSFISTTSFSVAGDQTAIYTKGRRVHTINSGGDIYSTVVSSTLVASTTTVVVRNDSGTLDSGLSAVQYGLLTSVNAAVPGGRNFADTEFVGLINFTSGIGPGYVQNYSLLSSVAGNALTVALKNNAGSDASALSRIDLTFRNATSTNGASVVRSVTAALSVVIPATATLGFKDAETRYINVYAIDNLGAVELAVANGYLADPGALVSTTVLDTAADSAGMLYSTVARTNVPIQFLGRLLIQTGTPAGNWSNAATVHASYIPAPVSDVQLFTASGTWVKPGGYAANSRVLIECWGAGGSGGVRAAGNISGGGGGGSYRSVWKKLSDLSATEVVTIGAGGASVSGTTNGNSGGSSSLGTRCTAYGGTGGAAAGGGGPGGGWFSTAAVTVATNDTNGEGSAAAPGGNGENTGGGGANGGADAAGGNSVYGGGGGGGGGVGAGGASIFAGAGGAATNGTGVAGTAPAGGGGSGKDASGAGARGQVQVTVFP